MTATYTIAEAPVRPVVAAASWYLVSASILLYGTKLGFSPVYFLLFLPLFALPLCVNSETRVDSRFALLLFVFMAYVLCHSLLASTDYSESGNLILGLWVLMLAVLLRDNLSKQTIISGAKWSIWIATFLLSADSVWRITHPTAPLAMVTEEGASLEEIQASEFAIYFFKFGTLMFRASNTIALAAISFFFLALFMEQRGYAKFKLSRWLLFLVLVSALSRAAYVGFLLGMVLFSRNAVIRHPAFRFMLGALSVTAIIAFISTYEDGSLSTKFEILYATGEYLNKSSMMKFLLGSGLGNTAEQLGLSAHLLVLIYLVGLGLVGLLLFTAMVTVFCVETKFKALYVIVPTFAAGLSYYFYAGSGFMFYPLAAIWLMETKSGNESIAEQDIAR